MVSHSANHNEIQDAHRNFLLLRPLLDGCAHRHPFLWRKVLDHELPPRLWAVLFQKGGIDKSVWEMLHLEVEGKVQGFFAVRNGIYEFMIGDIAADAVLGLVSTDQSSEKENARSLL